MGFWDTFVKVWQVRTSIKIQESLEESYRVAKENARVAKENAETQANIPKIVDELNKKNASWNEKLELHRKKTEK
jgi:hypothetical protein